MSSGIRLRPVVVKIGGSTLGSSDTTMQDVAALQRQGTPVVVVHGGGKVITDWLGRLGVQARFVRGLRVTDETAMEVVAGVLGGLVNKQLVAELQEAGAKAMGMSGVDGAVLRGRVLDPELGLVGEVTQVDCQPVLDLLRMGYVPVVAPIALRLGEDGQGNRGFLNLNADTAAGELAAALQAERLVFLTDVPGVLDESRQVVRRLNPQQAQALITSGVAGGGMIPKLQACLRALSASPCAQIVDGRVEHALLNALVREAVGTLVERG